MPRAEALFWNHVRPGRFHGVKFKRQVPIGRYVVDFLCASRRLIVELDGPPHETAERRCRDAERDAWLGSQGFRVVRFSGELVLGSIEIVLQALRRELQVAGGPSPCLPSAGCPSPAQGGGR